MLFVFVFVSSVIFIWLRTCWPCRRNFIVCCTNQQLWRSYLVLNPAQIQIILALTTTVKCDQGEVNPNTAYLRISGYISILWEYFPSKDRYGEAFQNKFRIKIHPVIKSRCLDCIFHSIEHIQMHTRN